MSRIIRTSYPIANKEHECMASVWLTECGESPSYLGMTISETKHWVKARQNRYKIIKGQKYLNTVQVWDGEFGVFKAIPEIHELCLKYDLYGDE